MSIVDDPTILAGHGRIEAAKRLGMETAPCRLLSGVTAEQKRANVLADDKLALHAGREDGQPAKELGALLRMDLDLDVSVARFQLPQIDGRIKRLALEQPHDPTNDALIADALQRSTPSGIRRRDPHRPVRGDPLDSATIEPPIDGERARMVCIDPADDAPIDGSVGGSGKIRHREFAMASDKMGRSAFDALLERAARNLRDQSLDGAIHFVCGGWRLMVEVFETGERFHDTLENLFVRAEDHGGMGSFHRSLRQLMLAFKARVAPHINTLELGQHGRSRTNIWEHSGVNTLRAGRMEEPALHPTAKPAQTIADATKHVAGRGEIVLKLFSVSGSTLIAVESTGRRAYLRELDPAYGDSLLARWQASAKDDAEQIVCG